MSNAGEQLIAPATVRKLGGVLLALAVPGIACHGYYAYEAAANSSAFWRLLIVLAYPLVLMVLVWVLVLICRRSQP